MSARRWLAALAWLPGQGVRRDVLIEADGERFTAVTASATEVPDGTTPLPGLTLPGLANAHSHAFHRALRSTTQADRGTFWTWRERMYQVAARLDPDSYQALARAVFAEMALAGVSCVGEFHYLHHQPDGRPYADPNAMGRAMVRRPPRPACASRSSTPATSRAGWALTARSRWPDPSGGSATVTPRAGRRGSPPWATTPTA